MQSECVAISRCASILQCDSECMLYSDCCADATEFCGMRNSAVTPQAFALQAAARSTGSQSSQPDVHVTTPSPTVDDWCLEFVKLRFCNPDLGYLDWMIFECSGYCSHPAPFLKLLHGNAHNITQPEGGSASSPSGSTATTKLSTTLGPTACYMAQCGCPGAFERSWCSESNQITSAFCTKDQQRCESCSGTWCQLYDFGATPPITAEVPDDQLASKPASVAGDISTHSAPVDNWCHEYERLDLCSPNQDYRAWMDFVCPGYCKLPKGECPRSNLSYFIEFPRQRDVSASHSIGVKVKTIDSESCAAACLKTVSCVAFGYRANKRVCELKSSTLPLVNPTPSNSWSYFYLDSRDDCIPRATRGAGSTKSIRTTATPPKASDCGRVTALEHFNYVMPHTRVNPAILEIKRDGYTLDQCAQACLLQGDLCTAFSYKASPSKCFLSSTGAFVTSSNWDYYFSSPCTKTSALVPTEAPSGKMDTTVGNLEQCKPWCESHPDPWQQKCGFRGCNGCCACADFDSSVIPCNPWTSITTTSPTVEPVRRKSVLMQLSYNY